MSMYASLVFRNGYRTTDTAPASIDPVGEGVYGNNLPKGWDEANAAAKMLRVTEPESFRVDAESDDEFEEYMEGLPEAIVQQNQERRAKQKPWHPVADGLKTFEALSRHYGEPPSDDDEWNLNQGVAWDVTVFVAVLREAMASGETEFHIEIE